MKKLNLPSKRRTLTAAFVYGATFAGAFVISPTTKILRTTTSSQEIPSRNAQHVSPLSLWKKDDMVVVEPPKQLDDSSTPWFFPREAETSVATEASSGGGNGRLGLIVLQTQEILGPAATILDEATDGWALGYADLAPESETTPIGQAFLATNIAYSLCGVLLSLHGELVLGFLTECASIASFIYHYTQLQAGVNRIEDSTVRTALMVDYVFAVSSILLAAGYLVMDHQLPPMEGIVSGGIGIGCLFACWVWEKGLPYIVLHSLWHLFSAYCGYIVGSTHIDG
jgi:hypothetical protein